MPLASLLLKIRVEGTDTARQEIRHLKGGVEDLGRAAGGISSGGLSALQHALSLTENAALRAVQTVAGLSGGLVALATVATVSASKTAAGFDSIIRGLASISKSEKDLAGMVDRLRDIARLPGLGFDEAAQGALNLRAAGLSADLSERSLRAFGNALATVGKGKSDLDGVMLALTQITSAGRLMGDELNQLSERTPQIRQALLGAFGTASTEEIRKMGLSAEQVIGGIVAELEKLPRVSGGIQNFFENTMDTIKQIQIPLGLGFNALLMSLDTVNNKVLGKLGEMAEAGGRVFDALARSGVAAEALGKAFGPLLNTSAGKFEEFLINGAAAVSAAFAQIPKVMEIAMMYGGILAENIKRAFDYALKAAPIVMDFMKGAVSRIGSDTIGNGFGMGQKKQWTEAGFGIPPQLQYLAEQIGGHFVGLDNLGMNHMLFNAFNSGMGYKGTDGKTAGDRFAALGLPEFLSMDPRKHPQLMEQIKALQGGYLADFTRYKGLIGNSLENGFDITGLNFGGSEAKDGQQKPGTLQDKLDSLLAKIEQNTRQTAEAVTLKELSTGGERGTPTALELRRAGGIGRASGDYRVSGGFHANVWERQLSAVIDDRLRALGAGQSPARMQ